MTFQIVTWMRRCHRASFVNTAMTVAEKLPAGLLDTSDEESDPANASSDDESDSGLVVRNCASMNAYAFDTLFGSCMLQAYHFHSVFCYLQSHHMKKRA